MSKLEKIMLNENGYLELFLYGSDEKYFDNTRNMSDKLYYQAQKKIGFCKIHTLRVGKFKNGENLKNKVAFTKTLIKLVGLQDKKIKLTYKFTEDDKTTDKTVEDFEIDELYSKVTELLFKEMWDETHYYKLTLLDGKYRVEENIYKFLNKMDDLAYNEREKQKEINCFN